MDTEKNMEAQIRTASAIREIMNRREDNGDYRYPADQDQLCHLGNTLAQLVLDLVKWKAKREILVELFHAGVTKEKREDAHGDTKLGFWQDTVFLGTDEVTALQALKG